MGVARNALLWSFVVALFFSVLFVDLLSFELGGYAFQRFLLVWLLAIVVTVSGAVLVSLNGWAVFKDVGAVLFLAFLFILLVLPFPEASYRWVEPGMYVVFFLGFVFIGSLSNGDVHRHLWVIALVYVGSAAVALYGSAAITVYLFALSDQVANLSSYIPWGFVNVRYWSHIATWLIPLLPLAVLIGPLQNQRLWRFFTALGAALWWWIIFLSTSRGTMLGLTFGVCVVIICIGRPALPWLKIFLTYLVYGVLAWLLLSVIIPSALLDEVSIRTLKAHSSGRIPLFIEAWRMSLENFPFGMGPQSWITHEALTEGYRRSSKLGHPHNMYLMWAAEYGWLLIAGLLGLAFQAAQFFWQRRNEVCSEKSGRLALPLAAFTASVSAALLHAGVSAVFMAPGSMLIGFLVLCIFWSLITPDRRSDRSVDLKVRVLSGVLLGFLISIPCYFWLKDVWAYHEAMEIDQEFYFDNVPEGTLPRFWFHGNFPRHPDQMVH